MSPLTLVTSSPDTVRTVLSRSSAPPAVNLLPADRFVAGIGEMAHQQSYDVCEMPIGTVLQALAVGQPLRILPAVMLRRTPHLSLVCRRDNPIGPGELRGRRVGVRNYAQTTGVWVRAVLEGQFGVPAREVRWVTVDPEPFDELSAPSFVERAPTGSNLVEMVRSGELDAVIASNVRPDDPDLTTACADPGADAAGWLRSQPMPLNHILVTSTGALSAHGDAIAALVHCLRENRPADWAAADEPMRALPLDDCFDVRSIRAGAAAFADTAVGQGVLPQPITIDEAIQDR